jgi:hypothetical protein
MKKIVYIFLILILPLFLTGCLQPNKSADYSFGNLNSSNNQNINPVSSLRVDYVYPNSVSTEGKEEITIFGNGFETGDRVFIQRPEIISLETYVYNPGYLKVWVPAHYAGSFFIGVVNSKGEIAISPMMFVYTEK